MRRLTVLLLIISLLVCFAPCCFGEELISRVGTGQLCTIDCRNGLTYRADFFISAVDSVRRADSDLIIEMDGGSVTLSGFFDDGREARQFFFADDLFISGSDFDSKGSFTGEFFSGAEAVKENSSVRQLYAENPEAFLSCCVRQLPYGFEVTKDGAALFGDEKKLLLEKYYSLFGDSGIDMSANSSNELYFRVNDDGTYAPVRQRLYANSGFVITCDRPECLAVVSEKKLLPLSEGRVSVTYSNTLGDTLEVFTAKITDENATPVISLICPSCGEDTVGEVHLDPCGHFTCQSDFGASAHTVGDCHLAGHCISDGRDHGVCKNCQGYLCDGNEHGSGICQHVHQWFTTSYTPGDGETPAHSNSICLICGQTLYQ